MYDIAHSGDATITLRNQNSISLNYGDTVLIRRGYLSLSFNFFIACTDYGLLFLGFRTSKDKKKHNFYRITLLYVCLSVSLSVYQNLFSPDGVEVSSWNKYQIYTRSTVLLERKNKFLIQQKRLCIVFCCISPRN